jgi:uncharacterized protein YcnI
MTRGEVVAGLLTCAFATATLSAHIMVSPPQSKTGATQRYELRVHNEAKVATTEIELEIPDEVTVTTITQPETGSYTTKTAGDRIAAITWHVEVGPNKYKALPFVAKNPETPADLHWTVHEHLADGSVVDWSDKPGSKEKGSVTKVQPLR